MDTKNNNQSGSLKVSEEVIAKIAMLAASEVDGVALEADGKRLARAATRNIAQKALRAPPVKAKLSKEAAEIDISVIIKQGHKAAAVGLHLQQAVKTAVQNMTGIAVSKINVKITGIRLAENV
ncbi:MAG: Asp23/Gls24 family envelope stress response protein [Oscillospiraceae bacterium]|nr:Asp23/Gls24 family envelope stress response protein [Oscillospiraceae bacterium]